MKKEEVIVCDLGRAAYEPTWVLQKKVQQALIRDKRAKAPQCIPHVLLFVEHPPVFTLGKSGDVQNLLLSEDALAQKGASFYHIDRGGDITFHGPGQLVGYPILDLDRISPDIHLYLRNLEEIMMRVCEDYAIKTRRVEGKTGVWVTSDNENLERKICAMGIRCSRWVTMHGFALNINTDLTYFDYIIPCGIANRKVTSLASEIEGKVDEIDVREKVVRYFEEVFDVRTRLLSTVQTTEFLEDMIGESVDV